MVVHLAAHLRRQPEMASPIAVQRAEHAFALDHFPQSGHHRRRRFLLHQLGVVNLARGIVQNHDQVVPAFVLKPPVAAAVDMQQHPRQRPPLTPLAMRPALASSPHQARSLQGLLHPGVTQFDPVLGLQLLVKVLHVQIEILLPVQCEHFLHRPPPSRRLSPPPVVQPVVTLFHVALSPTPHVPVTDPKDLRRLPPGDPLRHRLQYHILHFHCPLHRGLRVRIHACHGLLPSPPAKRTYHLLSQPDISCATDSGGCWRLTNASCQCTWHTLSSVSKTNCVREGKDMAGNDALAHPFFVFRSRFSKCSSRLLTLTVTLLGCVLGSSLAHAQATTSVRGTVTDPNGNGVPGAAVVLANRESKTERTAATGDQGQYQFLLVPPGSYTLTVKAAGFRSYEQKDLALLVNTPATANVELKVGSAIEVVTVTSELPAIDMV